MTKILKTALTLGLFSLSTPLLAAPAPTSLPKATQLQIEALLRHPAIQNAHIGLSIVALGQVKNPAQFPAVPYDSHKQPLLLDHDASKRFVPASNLKLFTAAWVLNTLGPDAHFHTQVLASDAKFVRDGLWPSSIEPPLVLTLVGDGDPSLNCDGLETLAKEVTHDNKRAFVMRAQNSTSGDALNAETGGARYPDGWTLDDALWYYGASVTGLAIERNEVDITLTGGEKAGDAALLKSDPESPFPILNLVTTVEKSDPRAGTLTWDRGDEASPLGASLTVSGFLASGQSDTEGVAVPDPRNWARVLFAQALQKNGAQVAELDGGFYTTGAKTVAELPSPPLKTLLQRFLKSSDNLYGEMLLRRAAATLPDELVKNPQIASTGLAARAHSAMLKWLASSGVPTKGLRFSDGSGLSRYDIITPIAMTRLLGAVEKIPGGQAFYQALPIAGVDGTLKSRMKNSAAQNNVRAKTGTFSIVNCLSGYVTTRDGQRLAVSILTNDVEDGELARNWEGRVFATLADASWRK